MKNLILILVVFACPGKKLLCQTALPFDSLVVMGNWKFERVEALVKKCGFTIERIEDPSDPYTSRILVCKQVIPATEEGDREIVRTFHFREDNFSLSSYLTTEMSYTTSSDNEEHDIRKYLENNAYYEERKDMFNNGKRYFTLHHIREARNRKVLESLKFMMRIKRPKPEHKSTENR